MIDVANSIAFRHSESDVYFKPGTIGRQPPVTVHETETQTPADSAVPFTKQRMKTT